ncbi:DDE_3 domain-containing protein [Trichonephila clavipes]|uniref:DDE_3 domain-containing protein n=1 Tax=Trichonephila clavipes TaxID=2585209 RepID=A0A8X6VZF3_TRICX|nr:DDE_3 domain-containing protein [Trichonephila clavipes]
MGDLDENQSKTRIKTCNEGKTFGLGQEITVLNCTRLEEGCIQQRNAFFVQMFRPGFVMRWGGEPIREQHLIQTVKHPQKQMFWGYFTSGGPGSLIPVEQMINSKQYIYYDRKQNCTYDANVRWWWYLSTKYFVPYHTSKITTIFFFQKQKMSVSDWPTNSPDVNPIQNLYSNLKRRVSKMDCSTKKTMIDNVIKVWFRDDETKYLCSNLMESMLNYERDLIQARGHILY